MDNKNTVNSEEMENFALDAMRGEPIMSEEDLDAYAKLLSEGWKGLHGGKRVKRNLGPFSFLLTFYNFYLGRLDILIGHLCQPSSETVRGDLKIARRKWSFWKNYF